MLLIELGAAVSKNSALRGDYYLSDLYGD